jgi:hypothetical protein
MLEEALKAVVQALNGACGELARRDTDRLRKLDGSLFSGLLEEAPS